MPEAGAGVRDTGRRRRLLVAAAIGLFIVVVGTLPLWGRGLAFFRVREVEVRGARFTPPADILELLAIDTLWSIWNDTDTLAVLVRSHAQISGVRVRRRPPGRLLIEVTEYEPVALAPIRGGLRAFDAGARLLPLDPTRTAIDVPIVARPDSNLLAMLGDLREILPAVFERISEVRSVAGNEWRVVLTDTTPVLIRGDMSATRFAELSSVEADLARRKVRPLELDLRFKDQVIARLP
ncbi:MAG: cell division protein FtsQ/DivIB [Gemmatimonadota bacterium]